MSRNNTGEISSIRGGIPIRALSIATGDHLQGNFCITVAWWIGEFDEYHRDDKYGNWTYFDVTPESAKRVMKLMLSKTKRY